MFGLLLAVISALCEAAGGGLVLLRKLADRDLLRMGQALGAGFLLSLSLLELLPEGQARGGSTIYTIVGFLLILLIEWLLESRMQNAGRDGSPGSASSSAIHPGGQALLEAATSSAVSSPTEPGRRGGAVAVSPALAAATASWAGIMVCAFADGVSMASAGAAGVALGILVFVGYVPHKFVVGFSVSSIMRTAGATGARSATAAAVLGLSTIAGAAITVFALAGHIALGNALCLSGGIVLYLAATEIIPELREAGGKQRLLGLVPVGVGLYVLTAYLIGLVGIE